MHHFPLELRLESGSAKKGRRWGLIGGEEGGRYIATCRTSSVDFFPIFLYLSRLRELREDEGAGEGHRKVELSAGLVWAVSPLFALVNQRNCISKRYMSGSPARFNS